MAAAKAAQSLTKQAAFCGRRVTRLNAYFPRYTACSFGSSSASSSKDASAAAASAGLSRRAAHNLKPLSSYFPQFAQAMERPWTVDDPDGCIVMVVAENRLMTDTFLERLHRCAPAAKLDMYYGHFRGSVQLRESLARFMSRHITRTAVSAEDLACGNGCGTVIDNLFHCLCDDGDAVLLPAPYYPTFINDLEAKCGLVPVPVPGKADNGFFPTPADLETAAAESAKGGHAPKALLLTNPTNPLGTVIDEAAYKAAIDWAVKRGMHVVSDEIYAASVFGSSTDMPKFVSAWDIAADYDDVSRERVHIVYGMAKDFGVSGLRIGLLATTNKTLLEAHMNIGYFTMIPNNTQANVAEILSDEAWVDKFLADNRAALKSSYDKLTTALDEVGVKYLPGGAAMFLWIDLRAALPPNPTWEDERALFHRMHEEAGVLLTPGRDCCASEPGYFRCCWAASPPEAHATAARRIASVLGQ
eukprot:TRINITY_DN42808_c0_g1_i1.p1 TRINITY_DN42808_c0_g1~~TRINITY_DN42808_c0_g1_i1.p1  ORF type:complete len:472 (-),score=99.93 TRINITY_DN42808_c0_g1_i1:205-1620(-)